MKIKNWKLIALAVDLTLCIYTYGAKHWVWFNIVAFLLVYWALWKFTEWLDRIN